MTTTLRSLIVVAGAALLASGCAANGGPTSLRGLLSGGDATRIGDFATPLGLGQVGVNARGEVGVQPGQGYQFFTVRGLRDLQSWGTFSSGRGIYLVLQGTSATCQFDYRIIEIKRNGYGEGRVGDCRMPLTITPKNVGFQAVQQGPANPLVWSVDEDGMMAARPRPLYAAEPSQGNGQSQGSAQRRAQPKQTSPRQYAGDPVTPEPRRRMDDQPLTGIQQETAPRGSSTPGYEWAPTPKTKA